MGHGFALAQEMATRSDLLHLDGTVRPRAQLDARADALPVGLHSVNLHA